MTLIYFMTVDQKLAFLFISNDKLPFDQKLHAL